MAEHVEEVRSPLRTCARPGCDRNIDHMAVSAAYCSVACRTFAWQIKKGRRRVPLSETLRLAPSSD